MHELLNGIRATSLIENILYNFLNIKIYTATRRALAKYIVLFDELIGSPEKGCFSSPEKDRFSRQP